MVRFLNCALETTKAAVHIWNSGLRRRFCSEAYLFRASAEAISPQPSHRGHLLPGWQTAAFAAPAGLFLAGDSIAVKTDYLAATRAKVGMAWDRALIYAAGGLETGEFDVSSTYVTRGAGGSPALGFTDASKFHFGFTVGAGVDYAVTNNVFIGIEYRYLDLGKETYNLGAFTPAGAAAQTVSSTVDLKASEVTARLNFKLGGLGLFGM